MSITIHPATGHGPSVNMHDGNAAQIFDLLGLTYDGDWGECPAEGFLGRVLIAQALAAAASDDEHGRPAVRDGRWTEGGRRPGYLAERLADLHEVATWAHEHHTAVSWC